MQKSWQEKTTKCRCYEIRLRKKTNLLRYYIRRRAEPLEVQHTYIYSAAFLLTGLLNQDLVHASLNSDLVWFCLRFFRQSVLFIFKDLLDSHVEGFFDVGCVESTCLQKYHVIFAGILLSLLRLDRTKLSHITLVTNQYRHDALFCVIFKFLDPLV